MIRQLALGLLASAFLVSACAGDATEPTRDAIFADAGASSGSDTGLTDDDASAPGEDAGATEDAAGPGPIEDAGSTGDTSGPDPVEDTGPADTGTPRDTGSPQDTGSPGSDDYVPLFTSATPLEPANIYVDGDTIVTHIADRGRDRHAREDQYQNYDHYLPLYWEHRTTRLRIEDQVASGGQIEVSVVSEWKLSIAEFRAWYLGRGTVATYSGNYAAGFTEEGPGTFDASHTLVSNAGDQYRYRFTIENALTLDGQVVPLEVGQRMEIELSQFLDAPPRGRANYYGTTFLYRVGEGGMVPWETRGRFEDPASDRENSVEIPERAWQGGFGTTLPYGYSDEPDRPFMQMATNLSHLNGQRFVLGRRVHHTDMNDGSHDEGPENGRFGELTGLAGPRYVHPSCDGCHTRNGRAEVAPIGEPLDRWVTLVGAEDHGPDPLRGRVLQPVGTTVGGEGNIRIAEWIEEDGLRRPRYAFDGEAPARYSTRIAPQLVGMGLLEAIPEEAILAWEDPNDADGDGISGRARRVPDPATGAPRIGRFGYKAGTASIAHQTASALNTDMGVTTSLAPDPDCGSAQDDCGPSGVELSDERFDNLVAYVALLGVRPQRDYDAPQVLRGGEVFSDIGCASCHRPEVTTSAYHPHAELRSQTIRPYTDLLLHDLGPGLADNLNEDGASGAEWRTAPLWSIGLGDCVTGGVEGPNQNETCTPSESYLHDGRARTLDEAIRWHGGEAEGVTARYLELSGADRDALIAFLRSL